MRPPRESKEEKFRRLAEARVNKIISMLRLLGNLSWTGTYTYSAEQVEQIFSALQTELEKAESRFLHPQKRVRKRFRLGESSEADAPAANGGNPYFSFALPDGTCLRAVGFPTDDYPAVNIYWDNGVNAPTDTLCFVEFNPEKEGNQRVCTGTESDAAVTVDFGDGRVMEYESEQLRMLDLGYASTVHKSQGAEYKSVIMNLQCAHAIMLMRAIVYTAITRAKLRLMIVGERKALCRAIRNTKTDQRGTRLAQRIQDLIV